MHAPSPLLLTIMCTIQGHMVRPHNYQYRMVSIMVSSYGGGAYVLEW
jgi:hypothetical protein